jgi:hypothetical protein
MSIVNALADGYVALGLGGGKMVYPGFGPAKKPTEFTTLVPTGGIPTAWASGVIKYLTIQVNTYGPAEAFNLVLDRATVAHDELHEKTAWSLDGYRIERIQCLQPPFPNGVEDGRLCITFNALLWVRKVE